MEKFWDQLHGFHGMFLQPLREGLKYDHKVVEMAWDWQKVLRFLTS